MADEDKMDEDVSCDVNDEDGMTLDAENCDTLPGSSSTSIDATGQSSSSKTNGNSKKKKKKKKKNKNISKEENKSEDATNGGDESEPTNPEVYLPGGPMEEGEELTFDSSAYKLYHVAQTGAPCLSFDILSDELGENRTEFPMTMYIAAGTQSEHGKQNHLIIMKMSDVQEMDDEDPDDDEIIDEVPDLSLEKIRHDGPVNRVRHTNTPGHQLVATWSETGKVHIWDVSQQIINLDNDSSTKKSDGDSKPLYSFKGHQTEGFAMDWSKTVPGRLATGDCNKNIHIWNPTDDGSWHVDQRPYSSHTKSVEDLQWSPSEASVFASCSVDQTIKIWDIRAAPAKACMMTTKAHEADVNVISWNRNEPLLLSGGDDGVIKVWDLRQFKKGEPVALFKHHTAAISSVEWLPTDNSVFAASGSDNQITLWDLGVEKDEAEGQAEKPVDVPPQLLFIHMGQKDIKELHWHQQIPGVVISTAENGFNVFKTISV